MYIHQGVRNVNETLIGIRAVDLTAEHIGRAMIVDGMHIGVLVDFELGRRDVTLYMAGRVITVRHDAHCVFAQ